MKDKKEQQNKRFWKKNHDMPATDCDRGFDLASITHEKAQADYFVINDYNGLQLNTN